ncbi:hypothetical protein K8W59_08970 [Nocardioides rotundus]|uniref:hypothetical protein n=1 Tax=Nocardioides rotundus TaxID=1774216 RepID=UPI001CBA9E02|nr:hypothetical protein [Nocardioides rotundus]UAL31544.1 hypothetical protein K8W59_08970 [Nocardioides rotundus]
MAGNEVFRDGDCVSVPVPVGTRAGDPVRVRGLNGWAQTDRANASVSPMNADGSRNVAYNYGGGNPDGHATVWLRGAPVFEVDFAVKAGDPVFITVDGTNRLAGAAGEGLVRYGHALAAKPAGVGALAVRVSNARESS